MKLEPPNPNRIDIRAPGGVLNPDVRLPPGMEIPPEIQNPHHPQPLQHQIRGLIQRLRGQVPHQVAPAPQPPPPQNLRSVLKP